MGAIQLEERIDRSHENVAYDGSNFHLALSHLARVWSSQLTNLLQQCCGNSCLLYRNTIVGSSHGE